MVALTNVIGNAVVRPGSPPVRSKLRWGAEQCQAGRKGNDKARVAQSLMAARSLRYVARPRSGSQIKMQFLLSSATSEFSRSLGYPPPLGLH